MVYREIELRTLRKATPENPRNSEASIIECRDGSLLLAWQRYEGGSEHGFTDSAPSTLSLIQSYDGGKTWCNERVVADHSDGTMNVYSPNFLRLCDGEIGLMYFKYIQLASGKALLANVHFTRSYDEGKTWGEAEVLLSNTNYSFSNDCIRRLRSGRVIIPLQYVAGEYGMTTEQVTVSVMYSDDDCKTWTISPHKVRLPMRGAMEPFTAECEDGSIVMVMRNQLGSLMRAYSYDNGITWTNPQTTGLGIPESCPYITNVPGTNKMLVIWNNSEYNPQWRTHFGKRSPFTIALTDDGAKTFHDIYDIEDDPKAAFSNPGVTFTSDGYCLLTYWTRLYTDDWLLNGLLDLKMAKFRIDV